MIPKATRNNVVKERQEREEWFALLQRHLTASIRSVLFSGDLILGVSGNDRIGESVKFLDTPSHEGHS